MTAAGMTAAAIKGFLKQQEGRGRGRGIQWRKRADVNRLGITFQLWNVRVTRLSGVRECSTMCAVLLNALGFGCINFSRLYDGGAQ